MESLEKPSRVRVLRTTHEERKLAKIDGTVIRQDHDTGFTLEVGNTGLRLNFFDDNPYTIFGDFTPGAYTEKVDRGILIFAYAINHLRKYLQTTQKIDKSRISKVENLTNPTFKKFLEKFFRNDSDSEVIKVDGGNVELDLSVLISLPDNDQLIRKITKLSSKAEGLVFEASQPV